ncbi:MAG: two pore domain potassium channel family protein [Burkholderiales bacterium]|nr:two pore domain potassium channel family protein [Burkholderiales bacterium]
MAGLLALTALGIFVLPVITPMGADISLAERLLLILTLASGIAAISDHQRVASLLALLTAALVIAWALGSTAWHHVLLLVSLVVLAVAIATGVFAARRPIGDRLLGAIVLYLLVGAIFAAVYALVAGHVPGAFAGVTPSRTTMFDWGYFSFVTLTTVGYGDISPVANVARSLAALEALLGQLYPAIIIARLVSAR